MLTRGATRCQTQPLCDIGMRAGLDWIFWPEKPVGWYNPDPMNSKLTYYTYRGYFRDQVHQRGNHTTINLCPAHYDLVKAGDETLAIEEVLLEEWCEAYYNRRRDDAREVLFDRRGRADVQRDPLDDSQVDRGRETDWG